MKLWPIWWSQTSIDLKIPALACAIAHAEGYYVSGAIPDRANNPGDLELGDIGNGILGHRITIYATERAGCLALYHELDLIFAGRSHYYTTDMTFAQFAVVWTGSDKSVSWATVVTKLLKTTFNTTLLEWMII